MEDSRQLKKNNLMKTLFIIASMVFAIPSIIYLIMHKTVLNFGPYFQYLYDLPVKRTLQTILYLIIFTTLIMLYFYIIKNRKNIFQSTKNMFIYITIISAIFILVLPFTSSDVFYYLGIGRLDAKYGQNPYYTTMKEFVESGTNEEYLKNDTVLQQGVINDWAGTTVVYGSVWTLICRIIAGISFGNIDFALFIFKLVNVSVHLLNCYLIYKISHKKIFTLLYGLNPFILLEGIACVHNDIFMVLFILLALYFLVKKKNVIMSVTFIAIATAIKYFAILLLPFIIIYYFREEKPSKRLLRCFEYGLIFLGVMVIPYLFYVKDIHVLNGIFVQQEKLAKSFYIIITEYFKDPQISVSTVNHILLSIFIIIYFWACVVLLNKRKIMLKNEMKIANYFVMIFLFLLITNFQPWYIMWLFPLLMWQRAKDIHLIIQISLISQFANSIFFIYSEAWIYGVPFTFAMLVGVLVVLLYNEYTRRKRMVRSYLKKCNYETTLER